MDELKRIYDKQQANRWEIARTTAAERIAKLKRIRDAIFAAREKIQQAIYKDYRKNPGETDLSEIYPTISEINHTIKHLKKWMKPKRVRTPITLFGTSSLVRYEAKGVVLILSPWNYPFQLLMTPLIAAISAGNCAIIKPSSKVPHISSFLNQFIAELFPEEEVALIEGSAEVADKLLEFKFDHIFFTGSPNIGKHVMSMAAKHLTPVTLELGGKSPVIVDQSANVKKAAERIVWGKFINAGQTCVAPDYLYIHKSLQAEFIAEAKKVIAARYGATDKEQNTSPSFCRLVSTGHVKGLKKILDETVGQGAKIECGGGSDIESRYMAPTLLSGVTTQMAIMQDEIFGPVLPILTFDSINEPVGYIQSGEKPLALYVFSQDSQATEEILSRTTAGGSCVNTLLVHLANGDLPFGGVGQSGMGNYHGQYGFVTFSHERAVLTQGMIDTVQNFYPPYTDKIKKRIQMAIKYLG